MIKMEYAALYDGGKIPRLGLGTWRVGGNSSPDYSRDEEIVRAFQAAIGLGYAHIDTAEMYGGGHTEELVGRAIRDFDRQNLFLTSKVWHSHLRYRDVLEAFSGSLKRLSTDYLDLYLIHWPNESIPLRETFRALNELVESGRVNYLGVSNFSLDQLREAQDVSNTPIATDQVPYSLFNREYAENGVLAYCQENDILLTAYTPIEKGRVANDPTVRQIAEKHEAIPVQVALKWLISQPKVIAIPMSTNLKHLKENLEALELELSEEELEKLNNLAS